MGSAFFIDYFLYTLALAGVELDELIVRHGMAQIT